MFGKLDKKLDMVFEKVAEADQQIAEIVPLSADPMVYAFKEMERNFREYELEFRGPKDYQTSLFASIFSGGSLLAPPSAGPSSGA